MQCLVVPTVVPSLLVFLVLHSFPKGCASAEATNEYCRLDCSQNGNTPDLENIIFITTVVLRRSRVALIV